MQVKSIPTDRVTVGDRLRPLDQEVVKKLAKSIRENGQLQPIIVTPEYLLIDGNHRLAACRYAFVSTIDVLVREKTADENLLAEIDANLCRSELTALQRMQHFEQQREVYERINPPRGPRVKDYGASNNVKSSERNETCFVRACTVPEEARDFDIDDIPVDAPFPDDETPYTEFASERYGESQRTIQQDLQTVGRLSEDVEGLVADTKIGNSRRELAALASVPVGKQREVVEKALAEGVTVQKLIGAEKTSKIRKRPPVKPKKVTDTDRVRSVGLAMGDCACACCEKVREALK